MVPFPLYSLISDVSFVLTFYGPQVFLAKLDNLTTFTMLVLELLLFLLSIVDTIFHNFAFQFHFFLIKFENFLIFSHNFGTWRALPLNFPIWKENCPMPRCNVRATIDNFEYFCFLFQKRQHANDTFNIVFSSGPADSTLSYISHGKWLPDCWTYAWIHHGQSKNQCISTI